VFTSKVQEEKQRKLQKSDHHNLIGSKLIDDTSCFTSKAFLIRYCEEEVEINDIGHFRTEIDVEPEYLNCDFFVEVELLFSDLNSQGGPESWEKHVGEFESKSVFKVVN